MNPLKTCFGRTGRYSLALASAALAGAGQSSGAENAPSFEYIAPLGFYDARHTHPTANFSRTEVVAINDAGYTAGWSELYVGESDPLGSHPSETPSSAWRATPDGVVSRVGLYDALHTRSDGKQASVPTHLNRHGTVAGLSYQFATGTRFADGQSVWRVNPAGETQRLGFFGPDYLDSRGASDSRLIDLNASGVALGISARSFPSVAGVAWLADAAGNHVRIGVLDTEHTTEDGTNYTTPVDLNDRGQVVGYTRQLVFGVFLGQTAWLREPDGTMRELGLNGPRYETEDGGHSSSVVGINEDGMISGTSQLFSNDLQEFVGQAAWIIDSTGVIRIVGVYDARRATADWHHSEIGKVNDAGYALGTSLGLTREDDIQWMASVDGVTTPIGIYDDDHRTWQGAPSNHPVGVSLTGFAAGYAPGHYANGTNQGSTAWVTDSAGVTTPIGLFDPIHTFGSGADTYTYSVVRGITPSGVVWGFNQRQDPANLSGRGGSTAWIHDTNTGETVAFERDVAPTGQSYSEITQVLENGTAYGWYFKYDDDGGTVESRAFVYVPGVGVFDLQERVDGGWSVPAGASLGHVRAANDIGYAAVDIAPPDIRGTVHLIRRRGNDAPPPQMDYLARLGFYGARHTHASGFRSSTALDLAGTGYSIGTSALFVGADDVAAELNRPAQTAWLGTPDGKTIRVGLYNSSHTRDDGRHEATPTALNEGGTSIGTSTRFNGHAYAGESAWVARATGTVRRLGYADAAHTGSDGVQISRPVALNAANQVIGYSLHPETLASSAWLAESTGALRRIGLLDAAHTALDGTRVSLPVALNDAGEVVGHSEFYVPGLLPAGQTTWFRHADGRMRIVGLQTGVHRVANGLHFGTVEYLTTSGLMAGHATRYLTGRSASAGQTAWLTPADRPNRRIGFYTGLHAGVGNIAFNHVRGLNEQGFAIGEATQFAAGTTNPHGGQGRTAWIATYEGGTVPIGLYDAAHSRGPFQFNRVRGQNGGGGVIGTAVRYVGGDDRGLDAWFANAVGGTRRLGLDDPRHQSSEGHARHVPISLTDSRLVAGISVRFNGAQEVGQTAWIYDVAKREYHPLVLSVRASDQFAWSSITELREDGSAIGVYRKFSASGGSLGDRAFIYLPGRGAFPLESLLDVTPYSVGWDLLGRPVGSSQNGLIIGSGVLAGYPKGSPPHQFAQGVYLIRE